MNTEPFNEATIAAAEELNNLPTRDEVIKLLARERTRIAAVYDQDGKQVHLDGRQAGGERGKAGGPIVCAICEAPAGEVTVERVKVMTPEVFAIAEAAGLPTSGYVCFGGDCAGQRNKRIQKMFTPFQRHHRATATGHIFQWDKNGEWGYSRTTRSVKQARARRAIQKQSRKANRSK